MAASKDEPSRFFRFDARNPAHREFITFLREQHLPGVDVDDEGAITLEIEQARLVLFGAGAVIGFGVTQMLSLKQLVCTSLLYPCFLFLAVALLGSWIALIEGANLRRARVHRRYDLLHAERREYLRAEQDGEEPDVRFMFSRWDTATAPEKRIRKRMDRWRYATVACMGLGLAGGVGAAIGTYSPDYCPWTAPASKLAKNHPSLTRNVRSTSGPVVGR